jgi:hypothetical protein
MPIERCGFEIHIRRLSEQTARVGALSRRRTVGTYAVHVDGERMAGLSGMMIEPHGPSDNTAEGQARGRRIEPGRYPLWSEDGALCRTQGYRDTGLARVRLGGMPRPCVGLHDTGGRTGVVIQPGNGFLATRGGLHPCCAVPDAECRIDHEGDSRPRVLALIAALRDHCGATWPADGSHPLPDCWCVIDDPL